MQIVCAAGFAVVVLLPITTALAQVCVTPPSGLVAWWPGDGNADDVAGGNTGTLSGNATFIAGRVNQSFQFDGTTAFVRVPYNSSLTPASAITVEAWVKPMDPQALFAPIVELAGAEQFSGYALEFHVPPQASLWLNILGDWTHGGTGALFSDVWTHVAGTYDGTCQTFYINGVLNSQNCGASGPITQPFSELHIGHDPSNPHRYYNGAADEVSIYNRALNAAEVYAIYAAGSAGKCKGTRYNICLLYDANKAVHSGATLPIQLRLCNTAGENLSSSGITLNATSIVQTTTSISGPVQDVGNANPDHNFRFSGDKYIFNLATKGLPTGSYNLNFTVTGDSSSYAAPFQVK